MKSESIEEQVRKFKEETGCELEFKDCKLYYDGSLFLKGTGITSLPDNLTVGGSLDLRGTRITALPDDLTVGGSLDLRWMGITSLPNNLTVGRDLLLNGTGITSLPDNLTVGDNLDLRETEITSLSDNVTVGGSLYLIGTRIMSLPDNLTIGRSLDLSETKITALPNNLTVNGYLDISGTAITSLPDNLTVGGKLYLTGTGVTDTSNVNKKRCDILMWHNCKYIKADGIFSKVISYKGNIYKINQIGDKKERYLVTDGNGKWSHGDTLKEAKNDLIYKISHRDKSKYENLTLDSELTFEEAIECYRVISGACAAGTKMFVKSMGVKKEKYTVAKIIRITKGKYGNRLFEEFFKNKSA